MKRTSLYKKHTDIGAKMVDFAGFSMPVIYTSIKEEHLAVRQSAGLFDVSHMGEFRISGKDARSLVQWLSSNDADKLSPGEIQYSCLPNSKGGIVDDLLVYCIDPEHFMLVVNASNIEKDFDWIEHQRILKEFDAELVNLSDETDLLALQGPKAEKILQELCEEDLSVVENYHFINASIKGFGELMISRTGYTGAGGFEIYLKPAQTVELWNVLLEKGKSDGLIPAGLAARDTLRLEMGYCLYGNDIDETTNPLEAGLGWITKLDSEFVGKDVLLAQKESGLKSRLVGFELKDKGIPRKDYPVFDADENEIGRVTSGTQSPSLSKPIGLAYVDRKFRKKGTEIFIGVRKKKLKAVVCGLPFV